MKIFRIGHTNPLWSDSDSHSSLTSNHTPTYSAHTNVQPCRESFPMPLLTGPSPNSGPLTCCSLSQKTLRPLSPSFSRSESSTVSSRKLSSYLSPPYLSLCPPTLSPSWVRTHPASLLPEHLARPHQGIYHLRNQWLSGYLSLCN